MNTLKVEISWGSLWRVSFIAAAVALFYYTADIWVVVFSAIVISYGLNPVVNLLEKFRIPRVVGTIFAFIFIFLILGLSLNYIILDLADKAQILLERYFDAIAYYLDIDVVKQSNIINLIISELQTISVIPSGSAGAFEFSKTLLSNLSLIISTFAIAFYLTIDHRGIEKFFRATIPNVYEDKVIDIITRARRKISYWVQAQIGLSFFIGILAYAGLYIIGQLNNADTLIENAFVIALMASIFEIIPFVGPFFTGAAAVVVAFSAEVPNPTLLAFYVLIYFVIIQQIEGHILIPTLMNRTIGLHPVAVLVSMLVGVQVIGFIGILLAVPASVVIQEFIEDWSSTKAKHREAI